MLVSIAIGFLIAMAIFQALSVPLLITSVGKERKPLTSGVAAYMVVLNIMFLYATLTAVVTLSGR